MAKVYKGNITGNIVELSLQDDPTPGTVQGTDATYDIRSADQGLNPSVETRGEGSVDLQTLRNTYSKGLISRSTNIQIAGSDYSAILSGQQNIITSSNSSDPIFNTNATGSVISGGKQNEISATYGAIIGGAENSCSSTYSSILGGFGNSVFNAPYSIAGGSFVAAAHTGCFAFGSYGDGTLVGGSAQTITNADYQVAFKAEGGLRLLDGNEGAGKVLTDVNGDGVGTWQAAGGTVQGTDGNTLNITAADEGTIASTTARGENSVDLQTLRNAVDQVASGNYSALVAGAYNSASGSYSTIIGCGSTSISSDYSHAHAAWGSSSDGSNYSTLSGYNNIITASNYGNSILGGAVNTLTANFGLYNTIVNGRNNTIVKNATFEPDYNVILSGENNNIVGSSTYSAILSGYNHNINTVDIINSGYNVILGGDRCRISGRSTIASGTLCDTSTYEGIFAWCDTVDTSFTILPTANNQVAFKAQNGLRLMDDRVYPDATIDGYVLTCDSNGVGTWQAAAGGSVATDTIWDAAGDLVVATAADTASRLPIGTEGQVLTVSGGAVAWGAAAGGSSLFIDTDAIGATERIGASTATALGTYATISGGRNNTASGADSTVSGGYINTALGDYSTVSGGRNNTASEYGTVICGGQSNIINSLSGYSTISGGYGNDVTASIYVSISGGYNNDALAGSDYSTIGGGYNNIVAGRCSWAGGRFASTGVNDGSFAWADYTTSTTTVIPTAANQFAIKAAGGLRLDHPSKGLNKVLTCDANGVGTWQQNLEIIGFACSDETTAITATGTVITTDWPMDFTITRVYASLGVAGTGSATTVGLTDVDAATQILNADLSLGIAANNAETSTFAAAASSYALTKGDQVTVEVNAVDSGAAAAGLKVYIEGYRS